MLKHYAICGRSKDDGHWYVLVALKATIRQEIVDLLQQYIDSHVQGNQYIAYRVDDIKGVEFEAHAKKERVRCLISTTATQNVNRKKQLLVGAP